MISSTWSLDMSPSISARYLDIEYLEEFLVGKRVSFRIYAYKCIQYAYLLSFIVMCVHNYKTKLYEKGDNKLEELE